MEKKSPKVSIIMNCYNCESFLEEAINSIYEQTFLDWEIIFYDNASTDRSADIANKYDQKLKYYRIQKNVHLGKARNLAMQKATGKYIAFLDCDDLYFKDKLAKQVEMMDIQKFVMSYGGALLIDKNGKNLKKIFPEIKSGDIFGRLLLKYEINMQSVMLLRSFILKNNLSFPEGFQYGPDYDLFMTIASKCKVGVLGDLIVKTRIHSNALTHKKLHRVRDELKSTIDRLVIGDSKLKKRFDKELKQAYAKFEYYQAVYFISIGKFKNAREILQRILRIRLAYLILYVIILLPLPIKFVMKLLNR